MKIDEPIIFLKTATRWFFNVFFKAGNSCRKNEGLEHDVFFQIKVTKGIELLLPPLQSDISPENGWVGQMMCFFLSKKMVPFSGDEFVHFGRGSCRGCSGLRHWSLGDKVSSLHTDGCRVGILVNG